MRDEAVADALKRLALKTAVDERINERIEHGEQVGPAGNRLLKLTVHVHRSVVCRTRRPNAQVTDVITYGESQEEGVVRDPANQERSDDDQERFQ